MKCHNGHTMHKRVLNSYTWKNKRLGNLSIADAVVYFCEKCDAEVIPFETALQMDDKEAETIQLWLWSLCSTAEDFNHKFITSTETAVILELSGRQAIHKNLKYKGMIYFLELNGKIFFLKESVEIFKMSGDGRLPIEQLDNFPKPKETEDATVIPFTGKYYTNSSVFYETLKEN